MKRLLLSLAACADRIITILDGKVQSNLQPPETEKQKARDALFASIAGNLEIGGAAAKEPPTAAS